MSKNIFQKMRSDEDTVINKNEASDITGAMSDDDLAKMLSEDSKESIDISNYKYKGDLAKSARDVMTYAGEIMAIPRSAQLDLLGELQGIPEGQRTMEEVMPLYESGGKFVNKAVRESNVPPILKEGLGKVAETGYKFAYDMATDPVNMLAPVGGAIAKTGSAISKIAKYGMPSKIGSIAGKAVSESPSVLPKVLSKAADYEARKAAPKVIAGKLELIPEAARKEIYDLGGDTNLLASSLYQIKTPDGKRMIDYVADDDEFMRVAFGDDSIYMSIDDPTSTGTVLTRPSISKEGAVINKKGKEIDPETIKEQRPVVDIISRDIDKMLKESMVTVNDPKAIDLYLKKQFNESRVKRSMGDPAFDDSSYEQVFNSMVEPLLNIETRSALDDATASAKKMATDYFVENDYAFKEAAKNIDDISKKLDDIKNEHKFFLENQLPSLKESSKTIDKDYIDESFNAIDEQIKSSGLLKDPPIIVKAKKELEVLKDEHAKLLEEASTKRKGSKASQEIEQKIFSIQEKMDNAENIIYEREQFVNEGISKITKEAELIKKEAQQLKNDYRKAYLQRNNDYKKEIKELEADLQKNQTIAEKSGSILSNKNEEYNKIYDDLLNQINQQRTSAGMTPLNKYMQPKITSEQLMEIRRKANSLLAEQMSAATKANDTMGANKARALLDISKGIKNYIKDNINPQQVLEFDVLNNKLDALYKTKIAVQASKRYKETRSKFEMSKALAAGMAVGAAGTMMGSAGLTGLGIVTGLGGHALSNKVVSPLSTARYKLASGIKKGADIYADPLSGSAIRAGLQESGISEANANELPPAPVKDTDMISQSMPDIAMSLVGRGMDGLAGQLMMAVKMGEPSAVRELVWKNPEAQIMQLDKYGTIDGYLNPNMIEFAVEDIFNDNSLSNAQKAKLINSVRGKGYIGDYKNKD